ncbi:unnamed protein product [Heligmosomoides polygyrus]|uniref:Protein kinase domain-containing protein n=1 Tax=Heligmosomoides polygyrus TaxID=6339 RepID=A0A3P8B950_HELPZ|nr:unnamed protein product [Heligmosomoides polygyrus]
MDFGDLTTSEVFRALSEGDYAYDSVEENLRRIMLEEKPNAKLPLRMCDMELLAASSEYMPSYLEDFPKESPCLTAVNDSQSEAEQHQVEGS